MNLKEFELYKEAQRRFVLCNRIILAALAIAMLAVTLWSGGGMSSQERRLIERVRTAQGMLYKWRVTGGSEFVPSDDPYKTGLIGLEWSELSTTAGLLEAKRTSCDPRWAVLIRRWMESLGLKEGDSVAIYSSSSFPGMAFNAVAALESLKLTPVLVVSLGSSVWGANDPLFPWPVIESKLRGEGFIRTKALFYTPGGDNETGGGVPAEARDILRRAAENAGVPLVTLETLKDVIDFKMNLLKEHHVKALISVGGSHANMGNDQAILRLRPGLHRGGDGGDGVIGRALAAGYPTAHLLNIKGLSAEYGIPFDAQPSGLIYGKRVIVSAFAATLLFAVVMISFQRWRLL